MRIDKIAFSRLAALGLLSLAAAACSQEAGRFHDPFANPFQSKPAQVSAAPDPVPTGTVVSQPIAPVATVPAAPAPVAAQPTYAPATTSAVPAPGWDRNGGTIVTVVSGDTVETISRRYGVPPPAILAANNLPVGTRLMPGQQIVIPVYRTGNQPVAAKPAPVPAPAVTQKHSLTHKVAHGETIYSLARRYKKKPGEIARANGIDLNAKLRVGQTLTIPGAAVAAKPAPAPAPRAAAPVQPKRAEAPAPQQPAPETVAKVQPAEMEPKPAAGPLQFRWPVQGRIISAFGPKPNGQHNDGFNIEVPENSPIKAAEDGIVAYAGNELKGYGNLVLIRHADGWITAYAHASTILVRRGEQVKRGQIIARVGQTGGVLKPQLHFEIRKGQQPMDPQQILKTAG
jgi:murein DD-endopeptidase MepM/ murein hydrolase activator NlpD